MRKWIKTVIVAGMASAAITGMTTAPATANDDLGSISGGTEEQQGGSSGTASATLDYTDDGAFSMNLALDDPVFTVDSEMPLAGAGVASAKSGCWNPARTR